MIDGNKSGCSATINGDKGGYSATIDTNKSGCNASIDALKGGYTTMINGHKCSYSVSTLSTGVDRPVDGQNPLWMPFLATVDKILGDIFNRNSPKINRRRRDSGCNSPMF